MNSVGAVMVDRTAEGVAVEYREVPRPTAGAGRLVVRPSYVGVCGSDLELLAGGMDGIFDIAYPHILGHEWSGTVLEVGGDSRFAPGDRVIGHGDLGDDHWFGVTSDGAMAEAFAVPEAMCLAVPPGVDQLVAALVEPFACVLNALQRVGGTDPSQTVVVLGCGALGMSMIAATSLCGAKVVAIDPSPLRRATALTIGAALALDPGEDVGEPADLVVEASGARAAQANALELAGHHARVLYMGLSRAEPAPARLALIQARDLRIMSSTGAPVSIWEPALRVVSRTGLDLRPIVSSIRPFSQCREALAAARDAVSETKVVLEPDGGKAS